MLALLLVLVVAGLAGASPAVAPAPAPPAATPAPPAGVLRATLDNGLRVIVVRDPLAAVVTTQINYLAGANETPLDLPGLAHAQEHMMFRGSPGLAAAQLSYVSAALGGSFDAATQQTVTQYFFTVAAEDLDVALRIEAIRMRAVDDAEDAWKQERGAIEQEVAQDLSNPQYLLYTRLLGALFEGTPYARDALGTKASFEKTTGAALKKFHDTWYAPNNAILVVVGDVQPPATLATIRTLFGAIPSRPLPPRPAVALRPVKPVTLRLPTDLPEGLAAFAFRLPGYDDPDLAAARVLVAALNSQRGVLQDLVVTGKVLDAGFSFSPLPKAALAFAAASFPQGQDPAPTLAALRATLRTVAAKGVDPDLVEAAKRRALTQVEGQKASIPGLASAWSHAVAVEGRASPNDDVAAIQRVTAVDVARVARRYLDLRRAVTAVLTPQPSGKPLSQTSFGGKESFTPPHTAAVTLPPWAESAVKRLAVPASAVHPVVTTLANGLRLIVQPESVSDTVSVFGRVKHRASVEVPKGREGVDEILDGLFAFGTETLDRVAFQRALDDIGGDASAGADFELDVLAARFDRGVELLADNELHPALPEAAFKILQRQTAARVAGRLQSAGYQARKALESGLFPADDPSLREATPPTISSLTLADVRAYYRRVVRPDLTTIVVIGNVTPERARAVVERHFGAWKAEGPPPPTDLPLVPANKPAAVIVPNARRVQDAVTLAHTLGLTRFDADYYALELGNHVLGGGFYATRLYRDLREKAGLVYYVDSSLEVGRTRGVYLVAYGCDPTNVARARGIVVQELRTMQTVAVPDDELARAKAVLLRHIPLSEASEGRIAVGLAARATDGLPLDEPTRAAHRYVALTAEDVRAAFARWIRPTDFVQVTEGPAPR